MRPKRAEVITAALVFIEASNPMDEMFVINFNEKPRRGLPDNILFTDEVQQLEPALWQGNPEGRTALYDAIHMALKQLTFGRRDKEGSGSDQRRRRQPQPAHTSSKIMQEVLASPATIYTIGIYDEDDPEKNEGC